MLDCLGRSAPHVRRLSLNPCFGIQMPSDTEAMALALIRLLHEATDGDPMQSRTVRQIDGATEEAMALAVESGSVALTAQGRELAQELGRLLY